MRARSVLLAMRYEKLLDEAGYPRGADGTRCSTIYRHYEFFDLGYYQIAMDCLRQAYGDPARSGQSGPLCRAVCARPPPCPRTAHDAALAADPGANGTKRRACSRRRWHARLTIASVRSRQQPPKCVKIRCLYRRPMQLLEALQVAADGLQVGG